MERMTPRCCYDAWTKATGYPTANLHHDGERWLYDTQAEFPAHRRHLRYFPVPTPTSAEWLADIVEASMYLEQKFGPLEEGEDAPIEVSIRFMGPSRLRGVDITLRRALCAALNGKACERKAA